MANTPTTNYAFNKPAAGDVGWHLTLNANFDAIDTAIKAIQNQIDTILHTGLLHANAQTMTNAQGTWLAWNKSASFGEANIICHRGSGVGGFYFDTTNNGSVFTRLARFEGVISDTETAFVVTRNASGVLSEARVRFGAVDSGGSGFRMLRIVN